MRHKQSFQINLVEQYGEKEAFKVDFCQMLSN